MKSKLNIVCCCILIMSLWSACESSGEMQHDSAESGTVDVMAAEDGQAQARLGMDRDRIFTAAKRAIEERGRLLGGWVSSGRLEGVVDTTRVIISLIPADAQVTKLLIEAAPLAGSGDVSGIAATLMDSIVAQLTGDHQGM